MVLIRNLPQPTDILSDSQVDLQNNNNAIDTSFGLDHFAASNLTPNNGKHAMVTTPYAAAPSTPTDVRFYAAQDHASIGPLQYTRTPVDQVPTPLSRLQSSAAAITLGSAASTTMLDFTGVPYSYGSFRAAYLYNAVTYQILTGYFFWNGSSGTVVVTGVQAGISVLYSGNSLIFRNGSPAIVSRLAWTLEFDRIFTPL